MRESKQGNRRKQMNVRGMTIKELTSPRLRSFKETESVRERKLSRRVALMVECAVRNAASWAKWFNFMMFSIIVV